jgi:hypothetical protein
MESRKRAAETAAPAGEAKRRAQAQPPLVNFAPLTAGDFSRWVYDESSGWCTSPCRAWLYNPTTYLFYHAESGGYYQYDTSQQTYVAAGNAGAGEAASSTMSGWPTVAAAPPEPVMELSVEPATMQGRRQKQEDRYAVEVEGAASMLAEAGCAALPALPAAFWGVYDGHAGHGECCAPCAVRRGAVRCALCCTSPLPRSQVCDCACTCACTCACADTSEFVAEQLHKDIATCLAAAQAASPDDPWAEAVVVQAIKDGYAKTDATFLDWARKRRRKVRSTIKGSSSTPQRLDGSEPPRGADGAD